MRRLASPVVLFGMLLVAGILHAAERAPGDAGVAWSGDGRLVAAVLVDADGRPTQLAFHDTSSGEAIGRLPLPATAPGAPTRLEVASRGAFALWSVGERLFRIDRELGARELALELPASGEFRLSPADDRIAFARQGDLLVARLDGGAAVSIPEGATAGTRFDPEDGAFAWSPDGRFLAFAARDAEGRRRVAVTQLLDPFPRLLETPSEDAPDAFGFDWRYDVRGLAVARRNRASGRDELLLCHAEKLYCRDLATRPTIGRFDRLQDFAFVDDGFLWGVPAESRVDLALFDTVGRERLRLLPPLLDLDRVEAVYADGETIVVGALMAGHPDPPVALFRTDRAGSEPKGLTPEATTSGTFAPLVPVWVLSRVEDGAVRERLLVRVAGGPPATLEVRAATDAPPDAGDR